jgi:hypothetical protein
MKMKTNRYFVITILAAAGTLGLHAQEPEKILPPTVEGSWVRTDENGSRAFENLTSTYKPAELTPAGKRMIEALPVQRRFEQRFINGILVTNPTPCIYNGGQLTLDVDSEGFVAVKSKDEIVQVQDRGADRHIYLNRKDIPNAELRSPSPSGYSVGRIDANGTLTVTVSNFAPARVVAGGYRRPATVLEQKYIPSPDGQYLRLIMTWNDPEVYVKPHVYEYTFERTPQGFKPGDEYCDATNPAEGQSVAAAPAR